MLAVRRMAADAKVRPSALCRSIIQAVLEDEAAIEVGRPDCDSMVARVLVLSGAKVDVQEIAQAVGVKAEWVEKVLAAWRAERARALNVSVETKLVDGKMAG